MKKSECIHDMYTRFSSIINKLKCLGEPIHPNKQVRKILKILPKSQANKVDVVTEAKDLKVLTIDALIGNVQTHKLNRTNDTAKKEKSLALKAAQGVESNDDEDQMAYLTGRF